MMEHEESPSTTVSSSNSKLFLIIILTIAICLIIILTIFFLTNINYRQLPSDSAVIQSLRTISKQMTTTRMY